MSNSSSPASENSSNETHILSGYYRHYKGKTYHIIAEAIHAETKEHIIVYQQEHNSQIWARPKSMFLEEVDVGGKKVPRFEYIGTSIWRIDDDPV